MKLALNATPLLSPLTGIGQYTYQIAAGLQQAQGVDLEMFYGNGWSKELRDKPIPGIASLKSVVRKFLPRSYDFARFMQQRKFTQGVMQGTDVIYHEPNFLAYRHKGPTVITVHDLSWIRYPAAHFKERVDAMERYFEPGLRRASIVLTDSEFVKREVVEVFGIDAQKIRTIPLGFDHWYRPMQEDQTRKVLEPMGLQHGRYLLAVGTLEPRKNLQLALKAYALLPQSVQAQYPLVIAGMKGWHTDALDKGMASLVASGHIRLTGYLPRADLAALTAAASVLLYPSIYEGFGLPPLEAMACGVPVIVSNVASLPEVVGGAGVLIDPNDADGLSHAVRQLLEDPKHRQRLSDLSIERARLFSWGACVQQTIAAYKQVLS